MVSTTTQSAGRPHSDRGTDLALIAFVALIGTAAVLWAGCQLATLAAAGHPARRASLSAALRVLAHPGKPAAAYPHGSGVPGPLVVWPIVVTLLAAAVAAALVARRLWRAMRNEPSATRVPGTASAVDVQRLMGRKVLLKKSGQLRPSLDRPTPADVGVHLGRAHGQDIWGSLEDSYLVVAPPRIGKGAHLVIPAILDAPGAVIAPSTKPDNIAITIKRRQEVGPVAVFDPQNHANLPHGMRWSPIRGCADPLVALLRAHALVDAARVGHNVTNGDYWSGMAQAVVRALLHAAALDGRNARSVLRWVQTPGNTEPVRILRAQAQAAPGWADELEAQATADHVQRDGVWGGVRRAFDCLADPRVLDAVSPRPGEEFDPAAFLDAKGTLYLLGTARAQLSVAPLLTALIEDVVEVARQRAAHSPNGRLDPPLLLALDEAANIAPLPSLPSLLADGGGVGIPTICVLQSLAQARARWGEDTAHAMWDVATIKVVLGGLGNARDLTDLSRLAGDRDEQIVTWTTDRSGQRTSTTSVRRVPILSVDAIRNLPFGNGIVLHRTARPVITTLTPWWRRPDGALLTAPIGTPSP